MQVYRLAVFRFGYCCVVVVGCIYPSMSGFFTGVVQSCEVVLVKAFVAQFAVEAFHKPVPRGLAGFDESQTYFGVLTPIEHRRRSKFGAIAHYDGIG